MSTTPEKPTLAFAGYLLDTRKRLLIGPDGAPVDISSRAFDTLYGLASHPHELVDKQRLMKMVWPTTVVEENNLNQQISAVRKALGETAGDHRFIVTVTGRGYRFVQDVERLDAPNVPRFELPPESTAAAQRPSAPPGPTSGAPNPAEGGRRRARLAFAAAAVLAVVAGYVLFAQREPERAASADTPSIAVLPFVDVSPLRGQDYFADGLSEELLNALGKIERLRVIGRTSSFSFKGKNEDVRDVAAALGVRHVLEGSVRRDGDRLRISAQLVDAASGSQLWAESYDRRLGDVFAVQKEIADSVAATLEVALRPGRATARVGGTSNVEAYEAYLAARAVINEGGSTQARDAVDLLEKAVRLDPTFALAWAALAEAYTFGTDFFPAAALPLTPAERERRVSRAALRAFELAPDAPETLRAAGMVSMQNRDWAEAERRLRKAVELAGPYDYDANLTYALFLMNVGRASAAIPYEERAMRAEPLLMRPIAFLAALHEMRGELDVAESLLLGAADVHGHEALHRQGLVMVELARHDLDGLRRVTGDDYAWLEDREQALALLRERYAEATSTGAHGRLFPVAAFASFLGDHELALDALRALGPTQSLHALWRASVRDVRSLPGFERLVQELGLVDYWRASGDWGDFCSGMASGGFACR